MLLDAAELRDRCEEFLEHDLACHPRQHRTETRVDASAKTKMAFGLAGDVVNVRVGEHALITIGRSVGQHHEIAGLHRLAMQCDFLCDAALKSLGRGVEAQRLLHRVGDKRWVGHQGAACFGEVGEVQREHA